ncbi:MAG: GSCFA domain-containing protein [Pseudomonadales bacterium]|jgi:hypothetical protein|nr:GSCFA domain-containing protein [Pseudomonadales bacterium]
MKIWNRVRDIVGRVLEDWRVPSIPARNAVNNLSKGGPAARWLSGPPNDAEGWEHFKEGEGADRVFKADPAPIVAPKFTLPKRPKIFASGSCFAREIEFGLFHMGYDVLSWTPDMDKKFNGTFHRYTTHAIINDFKFALEREWSEDNIVKTGNQYIDYTGHGGFKTHEEAVQIRREIINRHKRITEADVLFVTLGLVEAWFDTQTQTYTNTPPFGQFLGKRFELRITNFMENYRTVQRFLTFLRKHKPDLKIILTVSPVPLKETFSGEDIVIANTYSKSVLRAVAQEVARNDPLTDYFPSYEMVVLADLDSAWLPDRRHVRHEFVEKIIRKFMDAYMRE